MTEFLFEQDCTLTLHEYMERPIQLKEKSVLALELIQMVRFFHDESI